MINERDLEMHSQVDRMRGSLESELTIFELITDHVDNSYLSTSLPTYVRPGVYYTSHVNI